MSNHGETGGYQVSAIGATHSESLSMLDLPGIINDQQHPALANRRGNGLLPSFNVRVIRSYTE